MKKIILLPLLFTVYMLWSQEPYRASLDLRKTVNDRVPVSIDLPTIKSDTIEYHMPKIVPGTYSISDFGRFVIDFQPLDLDGNSLPFDRISTNRWVIYNAKKIDKINYWVEDSFDQFEGYDENFLFEPGGTSIEADRGVFVLNTFGFIGYADGYKFQPYELTVFHSPDVKGATSLEKKSETDTSDTFYASNYNFLADGPIMYSNPDITTKNIAGAEISVAVYSPNGMLSSSDVMETIDELMEAQAKYLGGQLPVNRYTYLIYLFDRYTLSGSFGALEHSYSSLYALPEMNPKRISQTVRDVAAHEFFHILTPLNIHSEEIHNFNYIEPEMSQHLWLYEGVTEYASQHVQLKYGLYSMKDFLSEMRNKMYQQEEYNVDIPYTEFSEKILEPENEKRYGDVYAGGALIAWCLDLTIIKTTNGEKDLQAVLRELSKKYGPNKPFKDEELFDEIESITNTEVGDFLRKQVGDTEKIPYSEILGWAGIRYEPASSDLVITAGKFTPAANENEEIFIAGVDNMNDFGKDLGLKEGDVLLTWNGDRVTVASFQEIIQTYYEETQPGDKVTVTVRRNVKGKDKEVKLKAKARNVPSSQKHLLEEIKIVSPEQEKIKAKWLGA